MHNMALEGTFVAVSVVKGNSGFTFRLDTMITCPLNETHIIPSKNLQSHLERCLIGDLIQMTCPWNSLHVVDETSYENHKNQCVDKPPGISQIIKKDVSLDQSKD